MWAIVRTGRWGLTLRPSKGTLWLFARRLLVFLTVTVGHGAVGTARGPPGCFDCGMSSKFTIP